MESAVPVLSEKLITAKEFARMPSPLDGSRQELVRGVIITMPPPGFRHGLRQGKVYKILDHYGTSRRHGRAVVESGILTDRDPDTVARTGRKLLEHRTAAVGPGTRRLSRYFSRSLR